MASLLSSLAVQKYELTLPTTKQKIEYRSFLVKEEKILMLASETKNESDMFRAMKEVVSACTFGGLDVEKASLLDIEYLFLKIRSRSVGETASPSIKCSKCNKLTEQKIDLSKVEPTYNPSHTNKIVLNENLILEMKYPVFDDLRSVDGVDNQLDKAINLLAACIDKVHTKNDTIVAKDIERSEVLDFIANFNQDQLKKTMHFIETMPKLMKDVEFKCSHCEHQEVYRLEGIRDFF